MTHDPLYYFHLSVIAAITVFALVFALGWWLDVLDDLHFFGDEITVAEHEGMK